MGAHRVTYISLLVAAVCFHALYPFWISWYILVTILLLMPFDFFVSLPGMLTRRVSLSAPKVLEQGSAGKVLISTHQKKPYPAGYIKAKFLAVNDEGAKKQDMHCFAEGERRYAYAIESSLCGITMFEIKRIHITSLIGLFSFSQNANLRTGVLILPAPAKPPNIAALPRDTVLQPKPGGSLSEDSELRPYKPGDPVRTIHWKLSAKYDSIIVREPMLPPPHSRIVMVKKWFGQRERDLILSRLRWISDYLLNRELHYCLKFEDSGFVAEITCNEDLYDYLFAILGNAPHDLRVPATLPVRYSWVYYIDGEGGIGECGAR